MTIQNYDRHREGASNDSTLGTWQPAHHYNWLQCSIVMWTRFAVFFPSFPKKVLLKEWFCPLWPQHLLNNCSIHLAISAKNVVNLGPVTWVPTYDCNVLQLEIWSQFNSCKSKTTLFTLFLHFTLPMLRVSPLTTKSWVEPYALPAPPASTVLVCNILCPQCMATTFSIPGVWALDTINLSILKSGH